MRVALLAGGHWHESELNLGILELGHDTLLINSASLIEQRPVIGRLSHFLVRASNRLSVLIPLSRSFFYSASKWLVKNFEPDVLIVWSSFALEYQRMEKWPVVVVRGSTHIKHQSSIFQSFPQSDTYRVESGPRNWMIQRESLEYELALFVAVPTQEICESVFWGDTTLAVNPYGFPQVDSRSNHLREVDSELIRLMFVGQTSLRKGIDRLPHLGPSRDNVTISVYGPLVQSEKSFEKPRLNYLGNLGKSDLIEEYATHDVFILLSREEGMARAGMEAISCGLPILVTKATGLSIWCSMGAGICLDDDFTETEFYRALDSILEQKQEYQNKCLKIAREWTWKNHAELFISQIHQNLGKA